MSRTTTPRSYSTSFSQAFDSLPAAGLPIFAKLATAINMAAADIPRRRLDSDRANAIEEIDSAASEILAAHLSEIGNPEDLKAAFTTLNDNPRCVEALLRSPNITEDVRQSAMESTAASTSPRSVKSFELLLRDMQSSPSYDKILAEALSMHKPERGRNSLPFIRCVLKHMWPVMPPLTDQGVLNFARAIAGRTTEEQAVAVIDLYNDLKQDEHGKYDTPKNREALAGQILSSIKPGEKPWHKRVRIWMSKIVAKIFGRPKPNEAATVTALIEIIKAEVGTKTAKKVEEVLRGKGASRSNHVPVKTSGKPVSTVPPSTPTSGSRHADTIKSSRKADKGIEP